MPACVACAFVRRSPLARLQLKRSAEQSSLTDDAKDYVLTTRGGLGLGWLATPSR